MWSRSLCWITQTTEATGREWHPTAIATFGRTLGFCGMPAVVLIYRHKVWNNCDFSKLFDEARMLSYWTKTFLYNQNTNFHLAQCFRANWIYGVWCSRMQYAKQASERHTRVIIDSSLLRLRTVEAGFRVSSLSLEETTSPFLWRQVNYSPWGKHTWVPSGSGWCSAGQRRGKKLPISIAMPGDGFGRAREVQVFQRWPSAQSSSQTIPSGRTEIRVNFVCLLREIRLRSTVKWAGRHCHLQYKCYLDNVTHFSSRS